MKTSNDIGMGALKLQDTLSTVRNAMEDYVAGFKPNATYKSAPEAQDYMKLPIVKAFVQSLTGQRFYFVGSAGIGKTSFLRAVGNALGYDVIIINAANLSVENLQVPFPVWSEEMAMQVLKPLIFSRFTTDLKKIIFIDEIGRADDGLANTLMELLQEGTLCGLPIPNLATVVAADNPQGKSYGRMAGLDFSQADRFCAVELDSTSTPWRRALADQFSSVDLTKVFSTYDTLDKDIREVLNPRVLAFLIDALLEGLPGFWALPIVCGNRRMLVTRGGEDVTQDVLNKIAKALNTQNRESIPEPVERAMEYMLRKKQNVFFEGRPGIGKTSYIKALLTKLGARYHYDSAAVLSPEDLNVPFPGPDGVTLDLALAAKFADPLPWVWIVDEIARGSRRTQNAIMEPIQERTVGGKQTNIIATVALNNPRSVAGFKLDVGKNDLAQASRFALSIQIDAENIPFGPYLKDVYGEDVATPFIEWWEDDLDDVGRVLCTPRALERMINTHEAGNELQWALPFVGGEYVKVPLVDLHARLEKRPLARLKAIVADVEQYEADLSLGKDEFPMEHATVFMAFLKADVAALEKVREVCVRLYRVLDRQHRIDLIRQGGERQRFWNGVLQDSAKKQ
jgi:MoxR-like ATPase